ncbi:GIY-YIG nuclease family protein [Lysinibacillus sp. M3]|uniref:GIY-YIG nuclease family protein n=1 Tax=Lysinibacillus zambalensis TaxID=3160866 RepID=A0ABV1MS08_9BACI
MSKNQTNESRKQSMDYCGVIYKATNLINGKIYIGQTIQEFRVRKLKHLNDARNNRTSVFHKAIRKYGDNNFNWEIIDYASTIDELDDKEIYWIKYYNSYVNDKNANGYNMKIGGEGNFGESISKNLTNSKIIKMFELASTGRFSVTSLAEKFNLGKSQVYNIFNLSTGWNLIILKHFTKEEISTINDKLHSKAIKECSEKISKHKRKENHHMWDRKGKDSPISKKVRQIDLETNEIIREFFSATDASKFVGACDCSKIAMVCRGKRKTAYGFKWEYAQ